MFFFLFLHDDRRIWEAQKHVDPDPDSDPDPQHWLQHRNTYADGSTGILNSDQWESGLQQGLHKTVSHLHLQWMVKTEHRKDTYAITEQRGRFTYVSQLHCRFTFAD